MLRESRIPWGWTVLGGSAIIAGIDLLGRPAVFRFLLHHPELSQPVLTLGDLLWWAFSCVVGFFIIPAALIKIRGGRLRDFGWRGPSHPAHLLLYLSLYLLLLPGILWASHRPGFQQCYPFYRYGPQYPELLHLWWCGYALVFISLEFFFRGFVIHSLAPRFGTWAVLISAVPYFLIHYHKPLPEMLGSFPAGLILGYLSLRTRSIAGGVVVHLMVAATMDLLVICGPG